MAAAVALLDEGRQPGGVNVMHGRQALLRVDASAHLPARPYADQILARVELVRGLLPGAVAHTAKVRDLLFLDAPLDQPILYVIVDRITPIVFIDAEIEEDHLRH